MENMRQKFDLCLRPLGSLPPRKGAVCEDLGRTQFTSDITIGTRTQSRKVHGSHFSESEDELDVLSGKNEYSSPSPSHMTKSQNKVEKSHKGKSIVTYSSRGMNRKVSAEACVDDENVSGPSSKPRPKPRPLMKKSLDKNNAPSFNQLEPKRIRKISDDGQCTSPLEELSPNRAKRPKILERKTGPAPFPMDIPAPFGKEPSSRSPPGKLAAFPVGTLSPKLLFQRPVAPFPLDGQSPPRGSLSRKPVAVRPFPLDESSSPLADGDSEDELTMTEVDVIRTLGGPRPFPMSFQFPSEPVPSPKQSRKRSSPTPRGFREISLGGDENVDPSTICPFCDEPWPPTPSPTLIALLERTKRKSYPDPRHGNVLGLTAPLPAFVELCQRHRFELNHLPLAIKRGWPTRINFVDLPKRIGEFKMKLKRLLDHPSESVFWRELREDAKRVGMMRVVSVTGQYATFERTQPGYYGEQGSVIIYQCLYSIFPQDNISTTSILPLTPDQFLTRVLVPEAALLLIQQDMNLSTKEEAMDVLEESKQYGIAMFPEQAQSEDVAEVGDKLAQERANAMRKVLEERGEADADVRREVEMEKRRARKAKAKEQEGSKVKEKSQGKAQRSDMDSGLALEKNIRRGAGTTVKRRAHRTVEIRDNLMEEGFDETTSHPAKAVKHFRKISTTSSKCSSLTSPGVLPGARTPSPLSEPSRAPPSSPESTKRKVEIECRPLWSYNLCGERSSSGSEIPTRHYGETSVTLKTKFMAAPEDDSDVQLFTDSETPKPQPRACMVTKNNLTKRVLPSDESRIDVLSVRDNSRRRRTGNDQIGVEKDLGSCLRGLGQTKRRKKAASQVAEKMPSGDYGWLLND